MRSRPVNLAGSHRWWKLRSSRMHDPVRVVDRKVWRDGRLSEGPRANSRRNGDRADL